MSVNFSSIMILGSFFFSHDPDAALTLDKLRGGSIFNTLIFRQETVGDFTGGFYLQPLLPYAAGDFYYHDEADDIVVLMSGSVFNKSELLCQLSNLIPVSDPELIA